MHLFRFIVIKIKHIILTLIICLFPILLIVFSNKNMEAAKSGLALWYTSVIPSLFPFFIATELLGYTRVIDFLGKIFNKIMRPVFNVPGEGIFPLLMGIISGYPVGAKIVSNFKREKICTEIECERLIAFTNNSGPLFILGTVGISLFHSLHVGICLLISHLLSCILVGFCFRWWKKNTEKNIYTRDSSSNYKRNISFANLGEILSKSISSSINSILMIGGFVVLFSVISSILESTKIITFLSFIFSPLFHLLNISNTFFAPLFTGFVELTNGLQKLSNIEFSATSLYISSFILCFGGLSVLLQVLSIIAKEKISIKPYIIGKLLQGVFSVIITFFLYN